MTAIRYGYYRGRFVGAGRDAFMQLARAELLPRLRAFPGAIGATLLLPVETEAGAPEFVFGIAIRYPDLATLHQALQSPARGEARAVVARMLTMFEGDIHHYIVEEVEA